MGIRYDRSRFTIVVLCDCGWRDLGITKESAYGLAADHEKRVHPERRDARHAATQRAAYYQQKFSDPER